MTTDPFTRAYRRRLGRVANASTQVGAFEALQEAAEWLISEVGTLDEERFNELSERLARRYLRRSAELLDMKEPA